MESYQFRGILVMKFYSACKVPSHHSPCHKNKLPPHATSPGKQKNGCKPCPSPHHDGLCSCTNCTFPCSLQIHVELRVWGFGLVFFLETEQNT